MPLFIHHKPLSPSATTSPHKKTSSCQCERHLPEKLSSRNFSSSLKLKGPQHSQDEECNAPSTSTSQCDAREIGNFEHSHRKGQKISIISQGTKPSGCSFIHLAKRSPQSFLQRQIKNRQQLYVTTESEKNKLETDEDKLDNHHDDPDCMVNKNWYKVVWRELKKQAKRIVSSEADADSSSDKSVSFDTRVTERHSDSRKKLHKDILPNENLALPSSEVVEVKIESWDRVTFHKIAPSVKMCMILESNIVYNNPPIPAVSSHVSIPDQNRSSEEKADTLGDGKQNLDAKKQERNIRPVEVIKKFLKMSESTHPELSTSEELKAKFEAVEKACNILIDKLSTSEEMKEKIDPEEKAYYVFIDKKIMGFKFNNAKKDLASLYEAIPDIQEEYHLNTLSVTQNKDSAANGRIASRLFDFLHQRNTDDVFGKIKILLDCMNKKFINRSKSVHPEVSLTQLKLLCEITTLLTKTGEALIEVREATTILMPELMLSVLSDDWINILPDEVKGRFINMLKSIRPKDIVAKLKLLADITTSSDKTGEELMKLNIASAGERSEHESTRIRVYRNIIRNETCRMMKSIDMVVSEAEHLFGHERTQIFFNLLDDVLFHFGSAGASSGFVPNMTESTVRQHVISFFEHSCDVMNRLMTLLLGCPYSKRLQQMPEQDFVSLMKSVINSTLKTQTKGGKMQSSKETTFNMVDSKEFDRALREVIPGEVLDRRGDEVIAHTFIDTRLERTQATKKRENRQIHYIYFPSDCRLFFYIPTEHGSYWHQLDMQRASRVRRHAK